MNFIPFVQCILYSTNRRRKEKFYFVEITAIAIEDAESHYLSYHPDGSMCMFIRKNYKKSLHMGCTQLHKSTYESVHKISKGQSICHLLRLSLNLPDIQLDIQRLNNFISHLIFGSQLVSLMVHFKICQAVIHSAT